MGGCLNVSVSLPVPPHGLPRRPPGKSDGLILSPNVGPWKSWRGTDASVAACRAVLRFHVQREQVGYVVFAEAVAYPQSESKVLSLLKRWIWMTCGIEG